MILDPKALWSTASIAEYADLSHGHVSDRVITSPDFPIPIRLSEKSHPRWVAGEVMEWFNARRMVA